MCQELTYLDHNADSPNSRTVAVLSLFPYHTRERYPRGSAPISHSQSDPQRSIQSRSLSTTGPIRCA